jgi:hypothetical protein
MTIGWPSGWNPLPAKGLARALSKVALVGCALSASVHLITLLGFYNKAIFKFQMGLFLAIFPMSLPALFATQRLQSELTARNPFWMFNPSFSSKVRKMTLANTPEWLRRIYKAFLFYFIAFFVVFVFRTFPKNATKLDEVQMFSACAASFYSGIAAILTAYAGTERPLRLDEI